MNAWYDKKTNLEVVNLKLWEKLQNAVDIFGLSGLDRLLCFMIVQQLQWFLRYFNRELLKTKQYTDLLFQFMKLVGTTESIIRESHDHIIKSHDHIVKSHDLY
jgi:WASH complex subunit strumpellin